jgi:hypothetical protein
VELAWTAPLFPPPVTGYLVERAADEGFAQDVQAFTVARDATTYTDAAVQGGTTYFYRVRTESAAGWSAWSAAAEVSVP